MIAQKTLNSKRVELQSRLDILSGAVAAYQALVASLGSGAAARDAVREVYSAALVVVGISSERLAIANARLAEGLQSQGLADRIAELQADIADIDAAIASISGG